MSAEPTVPDWTLGWRLRRALDFAGVSVAEMADELGVGRTTVSGWLNDPDRHPRRIYLRYWADRCRVPLDWLERGELPRVDSNHQPAGLLTDLRNPWPEHASNDESAAPAATRADLLALSKRIPLTRADPHRTPDHPSTGRAVAR